MKRIIVFFLIIVVSVGMGFSWTFIEDTVEKAMHPIKYEEHVERFSDEYGVPEEIIYAVIKCESSFKADAISSGGAVGLMQMMPATFEDLCRRKGEEYNESLLYDPKVSIEYGTYYLSYLYSRYGVWETVYAAYNAGYGRVDGWLEDPEIGVDGRLNNIPYKETREYVEKVADARKVYSKLIKQAKDKATSDKE